MSDSQPSAKKKVYISSTFKDLSDYRDVVLKEFNGIYSETCELSRVMEYMYDNGQSIPNVDVCLEEVKKSNLYLLIIGSRVGSFVPGINKTYTEMEYETALQSNTSIFRFINTSVKPNETDHPEKYIAFKKKLDGLPVHEFKDIDSFKIIFFKFMSYYVQIQSGNSSDRRYYILMATLIGLIGLLGSLITGYMVNKSSADLMLSASAGAMVLLIFACIVTYTLKNIIFPTANSTRKN